MRSGLVLLACLGAAAAQWPNLCPNQPADAYAQVRCPANATCSPNGFSEGGGQGCCPWPNAVSCPSGYQCCPAGTTCTLISGATYGATYSCDSPSAPSVTSKCPCKPGAPLRPSATKKNVLVIGDSLSIGYTPAVAANLSDVALVQHAPFDVRDGGAEEAAYLLQCLDFWTAHPSGIPFVPDLVWFNSGMHNLATAGTPGHGTVPGQGGNSSEYGPQLAAATTRLVAWAAANKVKLIYAWTTPYLNNAATDAVITGTLNPAAGAIMTSCKWAGGPRAEQGGLFFLPALTTLRWPPFSPPLPCAVGIPQVDLHKPIIDKCGAAPQASCFGQVGCWSPHCPPGYSWLATNFIAPAIRAALATP